MIGKIRACLIRHTSTLLLLATLQAVPIVAIAALASFDIVGATRARPTTMGAFEVNSSVSSAPLPAPTGLTVTRLP